MTLFDNMLELNNSFLLIALIIIAVICIYLLYSNLTKSGETASLKSGITALIQQNKKRDEIINFLLERVENLEHNVTPPQILPVAQDPLVVTNTVTVDDIDAVLDSVEQPVVNTVSSADVEDILESINTTETVDNAIVDVNTVQTLHAESVLLSEDVKQCEELMIPLTLKSDVTVYTGIESSVPNVNSTATAATSNLRARHSSIGAMDLEFSVGGTSVGQTVEDSAQDESVSITNLAPEQLNDFSELESEFDGLLTTENVTQHNVTEPVAGDLVSALLDADEESLAGDHEFDLSTVPKGKDKLNAQYTVKQLKALSRQLKLKSKGNKSELINRIYEKLN